MKLNGNEWFFVHIGRRTSTHGADEVLINWMIYINIDRIQKWWVGECRIWFFFSFRIAIFLRRAMPCLPMKYNRFKFDWSFPWNRRIIFKSELVDVRYLSCIHSFFFLFGEAWSEPPHSINFCFFFFGFDSILSVVVVLGKMMFYPQSLHHIISIEKWEKEKNLASKIYSEVAELVATDARRWNQIGKSQLKGYNRYERFLSFHHYLWHSFREIS